MYVNKDRCVLQFTKTGFFKRAQGFIPSDGKAQGKDEAGAKAEWSRRAKSSPELFSTAESFIVQADVNGRTVYRVRAGSFATTADADAFCNAYKAKGGQCFRVAK